MEKGGGGKMNAPSATGLLVRWLFWATDLKEGLFTFKYFLGFCVPLGGGGRGREANRKHNVQWKAM